MANSFCSTPEAHLAFELFLVFPILFCMLWAVTSWSLLPLTPVPSIFILYLWFFEGIPWRGRDYGYCCMPGGSLTYSGEQYDCYACKHIERQLDCTYGCLVDPIKFAHKDDWRNEQPCSDCWRSGAQTMNDRYKGPVRWEQGERP